MPTPIARRAVALRWSLLTALGCLPLHACGGSATRAPSGSGGAVGHGGSDGLGGATTDGGSPTNRGGNGSEGGATATGGREATGGTQSASGGMAQAVRCKNPEPQPGAPDGSFIACSGGWRHRPAIRDCSPAPRTDAVLPHSTYPTLDECTSDLDCDRSPNGYCLLPTFVGADLPTNHCVYGCVRDADCNSPQAICECWGTIGTCVLAYCKSDAECGEDLLCASYDANPDCGDTTYACQTPLDACAADEDCSNFRSCTIPIGKSARACEEQICVIGRPFLVGGSIRYAAPVRRPGWSVEGVAPDESLTASECEALAQYWARVGCLEHASIAAFARFTLELLAFGAPAELIELTNRALADETLHAKLAFSLASRYAGAQLGPGPLEMGGAVVHTNLRQSVFAAFEEGCIGETIAALEAARARDGATDDAVRAALGRIAEDEARHAELAFRFVQWALPELGDEVARALLQRAELACESAEPFGASDAQHGPALARHGVLSKEESGAVRRSALRDIVLPCVRALVQNTAGSVYVPNTERSTSQISCRLA